MKINRYPGVKPFSPDEQAIFFGRDRDIADLCDLVRVEKTCVLFGKSGYGKSSLLQAGVLPRLAPNFQPIEVRFGEFIEGQSLPPIENLRRAAGARLRLVPLMAFAEALPASLWTHFKKFSGPDSLGYLLVFDQFEEFFSYPAEQQRAFREQLAEILHDELPENLREAARSLPREQRRLLALAPEIRLLLALRSDRLHELDRMKDYLPALLHKRYELRALSREQAREAVLGPAGLTGDFASSAFSYSETALQRILADLSRSNTASQAAGVEAFQLQILCDNIESRVAEGLVPDRDGDGLPDVMPEDLPDFSEVFGQYYERRLAQLPDHEQPMARRVIEDGLVRLDPATGEGRRLSVDGDALLQQFGEQGLTPALLRALEATFLLRREPNTLGGYNYELSHDTLLAPITAAAKERRQREEEERLLAEAERQKAEQKKIEAARRRNILVGLGALALLAFAFYQTWEANRAKDEAKAMTQRSQKSEAIAADKTTEAVANLRTAEAEQEKARLALIEVEKQTSATEEQKQLARQNLAAADRALALARQATAEVVQSLLENAANSVYHLRYEEGRTTLQKAASLGQKKPEVARALFEIAFFFHETGQTARADSLAADIARLLGRTDLPTDLTTFKKLSNLELLQTTLQALQAQYYGNFAHIPGDSDTIGGVVIYGDSIPPLTVTISPFRLAATETTWWQYNLFCTATGYPQPTKPGWGSDGDNPVVNVSWYDAAVYCNWRSHRERLQPAYTIDSVGRSQDEGWDVTFDATANGFRLPTEAEWEYAARAGTNFEYAGDSLLQNVGWHGENSGSRTHPVAQKKANAWELYDMSGNVWEWCWDRYGAYPEGPVKDYRGPDEGPSRVWRGGAWNDFNYYCSVSRRYYDYPWFRVNYCGFRLAQDK